MSLAFSLTPTVIQFTECSNRQSWSPGDAGCVPWLTLLSPNLWQAQGPLCPCDTLLSKLNPLLFFLVCDVITLGTATSHRTPILFSFPAIKYYVWDDFGRSFPKMGLAVLRSTWVFIRAVPHWGRNDQSLCATDNTIYYNPKCPWPSLCMALSLSLLRPIIWPNEKSTIVVSLPVVYQINKCLMTLSVSLFSLISGGDRFAGWMTGQQQTVNLKQEKDCQPLSHCVYCCVQLLDCYPSHLTIADHQWAQLCGWSHLNILLQTRSSYKQSWWFLRWVSKMTYTLPVKKRTPTYSQSFRMAVLFLCVHLIDRFLPKTFLSFSFCLFVFSKWGTIDDESLQQNSSPSDLRRLYRWDIIV